MCPSVSEWIKNCGTFTEWIPCSGKKELLSFGTAWMELERIMLSETSHTVKGKYCMFLAITGTQ